jgi:hypothetical protein
VASRFVGGLVGGVTNDVQPAKLETGKNQREKDRRDDREFDRRGAGAASYEFRVTSCERGHDELRLGTAT